MAQVVSAYIGIGSNLDNPLQHVQQAVVALAELPTTVVRACSPWYRSTAIGPGEQPDYVNGVVHLETQLTAQALFTGLQSIEQDHGRERRLRWAARTLDLDLLLYGDRTIATDQLTVPHPRLAERNFVLYPLADISPDLILPNGVPLQSLLACCETEGLWKLDDATA